jgi:hypothetical protein
LGVGTNDTVIHPGLQILQIPPPTQTGTQSQSVYDANKESDQDASDLADLKQQYTDLWNQWKTAKAGTTTAMNQYVARLDPNNGINGKNVFLPASASDNQPTDANAGYTTRKGIFKPYVDGNTFQYTAGQRGCPPPSWTSVPNAGYTSGMAVGSLLTSDPELVVGSAMRNGQSCGFEGENVYVSTLVSQPKSSYLGCYFDAAQSTTTSFVPPMTGPTTQGFTASATNEIEPAYVAWHAFDGNPNTSYIVTSTDPYDSFNVVGLSYQVGGNALYLTCPQPFVVTGYSIEIGDMGGIPSTYHLLGRASLDDDWVDLHDNYNNTDSTRLTAGVEKSFITNNQNKQAFTYFALCFASPQCINNSTDTGIDCSVKTIEIKS